MHCYSRNSIMNVFFLWSHSFFNFWITIIVIMLSHFWQKLGPTLFWKVGHDFRLFFYVWSRTLFQGSYVNTETLSKLTRWTEWCIYDAPGCNFIFKVSKRKARETKIVHVLTNWNVSTRKAKSSIFVLIN